MNDNTTRNASASHPQIQIDPEYRAEINHLLDDAEREIIGMDQLARQAENLAQLLRGRLGKTQDKLVQAGAMINRTK